MTKINRDQFKLFIDAVSAIVDECRCHIDKKGMSVITVDQHNVAMVFAQIKVKGLPELTPGINVKRLSYFLKMIKSEEVDISFKKVGEKDVMIVSGDKRTVKSTLILDAMLKTDPNPPKFETPFSVSISGLEFVRAIKESVSLSDKVRFVFADGLFCLQTTDEDKNEVSINLGENVTSGEAQSLFSDTYLKKMIKPIKKDDMLSLYANQDHPFKLSFSRDNVNVTYLQAPRIEAD